MPLYLTISDGKRADQAVPIVATSDRKIIGLVAKALVERLIETPGDLSGPGDWRIRRLAAVIGDE